MQQKAGEEPGNEVREGGIGNFGWIFFFVVVKLLSAPSFSGHVRSEVIR